MDSLTNSTSYPSSRTSSQELGSSALRLCKALQLTGPSRHQAVSMHSLVLVLCPFCSTLQLSCCQVTQGTWWSDFHAVAQYTELRNWVRKTGRSVLISQPAVPSFLTFCAYLLHRHFLRSSSSLPCLCPDLTHTNLPRQAAL